MPTVEHRLRDGEVIALIDGSGVGELPIDRVLDDPKNFGDVPLFKFGQRVCKCEPDQGATIDEMRDSSRKGRLGRRCRERER